MVLFFFFLILQNSVHMLSSQKEKPFVLSVSKYLFPLWNLRSLSCCQKRESIVSSSDSASPLSQPRLPAAANWPAMTGGSWLAWLACHRGAIRQVLLLKLCLHLCHLLCVTQQQAMRETNAEGPCELFFLSCHLTVLCTRVPNGKDP